MTTKNFKARIGVEAPLIAAEDGTTALTLSSSTGNVAVAGDLTVTGNDIKSSSATALTLSGANVTVAGTLELDGNIVKSSSGTTAITLYNGSGDVAVAGDLILTGNQIRSSNLISSIRLSNDVNGDVTVNGDLSVGGNDIKASDGTTAITLSASTGNVTLPGTLDVQGGTITESTGALSITTGAANGSITLDPNGTGNIVMTLADGGNLTNTRNYVLGAVRNATTLANGDMWSLLSGTGTGYRGISLDNSALTTKAPATVIRGFTGGAVAGNATTPRVVFERARGTSASPTAIQSADFLGQFTATGANGAGTFLGDTVAAAPATMTFFAAENWASNTNVGTTMSVGLMPTAKTLASVATPTIVYTTNPQSTTWASDAFTWTNGNTIANPNTSTKLTLDNTGQLSAKGNIATTGTLTFNNEVAINAVSELLNTNTAAGTSVAIQTNYRPSSGSATYSLPQVGWSLGNFRFNSYNTTAGAYALGPTVQSVATENWTGSANGSRIIFTAVKQGTTYLTGQVGVASFSPETAVITSDTITFEDSAGTDYAVLNANTAKFSVPVTTELTSATISEGTTYTPAATVNNNLNIQINVLAGGTTVFDLASLTGNTRGASYNILVFNNTGTGAPIQVKNTRINTNNLMTHTITTGNRIIINAYVVGDYATATHLQIP